MNKLARLPIAGRTRRASGRRFRRAARRHTRYFAFLSYSHKDEALAEWLHSQLEEFRVPRRLAGHLTENGIIPKRLRPIFRDQHELAAADDLGEEIEEALANSQYLIVLCSPAAAKSHWTNAEIETFKRTRPDGCVLAAIAAGEPFASEIEGREAEECFPRASPEIRPPRAPDRQKGGAARRRPSRQQRWRGGSAFSSSSRECSESGSTIWSSAKPPGGSAEWPCSPRHRSREWRSPARWR